MLVKEYMNVSTHIRIFDDYCSKQSDDSETKNIILSLLLKNLENDYEKHEK